MADKEIYELEIEIDNRDVDKTQKKLRSLDKLLQQTQRRAGLLGKTRIKPAVTLDDRFSSAARKIGDTLTRLHRTTVKPVAELDDRASKAAVKLYATLAALSAPRWRVSVAGVDWETAVGDSFTKWISSDGKSTMQRISSSIASALGGGLKEKIMQELGYIKMPEKKNSGQGGGGKGRRSGGSGNPKRKTPPFFDFLGVPKLDAFNFLYRQMTKISPNDISGQTGGPSSQFQSWIRKAPVYAEAGIKSGQSFFKSFLTILDPLQVAEKLGASKWGPVQATQKVLSGLGIEFKSKSGSPQESGESSTSSKKKSPLQDVLDGTFKVLDFGGKVIQEYFKDRYKELLDLKLIEAKNSVKNWWQAKWPGLRSRLEPKISPQNMRRLTNAGTKSLRFLGNVVTPVVKRLGGYAGVLMDGIEIFSAKPGRERYQKVTSAILGGVLGALGGGLGTLTSPVTGPVGPAVGSALGATVGGLLGDPLGSYIYDLFHGKIEQKPQAYSDRKMAPGVQGITPPEPYVPRVMGTPVPNYYEVPEELRSKIGGPGYFNKPVAPVNVSLSQGALNLTVNKDEINYDELAKAAGWKIANEVRFAMQNLK